MRNILLQNKKNMKFLDHNNKSIFKEEKKTIDNKRNLVNFAFSYRNSLN